MYPPPDPVVCWERLGNACRITGVIRASVMPVGHLIAKRQRLILLVMAMVTMVTGSITPVAAVAMSMISMVLKLSMLSVMATRTIASVTSVSVSMLAMMRMGIPGKVEGYPSIPVISHSVVAYLR